MGKKLAIQGHTTRGKEVIEILEMLGGVAAASKGFRESYCYYISEDTATKYISWDYIGPEKIEKYKIFTLEEFLKKYPFKVGDKVVYTKFGDNCDDYPVTIESMEWTGTSGRKWTHRSTYDRPYCVKSIPFTGDSLFLDQVSVGLQPETKLPEGCHRLQQ